MRRKTQLISNYSSLENRRLLAGDVSVWVADSVLNIVGDSLANEIDVTRSENGSLVVTGIDTTVNGSNAEFTVTDPFRFMSLFLREGDDLSLIHI